MAELFFAILVAEFEFSHILSILAIAEIIDFSNC